jgi:hypothetical protein
MVSAVAEAEVVLHKQLAILTVLQVTVAQYLAVTVQD